MPNPDLSMLSQITAQQQRISQALSGVATLMADIVAAVEEQERRITTAIGERPQTADLDAACFSVYLHGDWRWLTRNMTTDQKEAFADAADRHEATWPDDDRGTRMDRWWRDDAPIPTGGEPNAG
jgi:hypothetical protein